MPEIARRARELGVKVSFDLNYRATLWSPKDARAAWVDILPHVNLLITTESDAAILLNEAHFVGAPRCVARSQQEAAAVETGRRAVSPAHGASAGDNARCAHREAALRRLHALHHPDAIAMTCGGDGSAAFDGNEFLTYPSWPLEPINRLGAGDAFAAGLLYGLISADLQTGLAYGNAMSVLKFTVPQNLPLIDRADVEALIAGRDTRRLVR